MHGRRTPRRPLPDGLSAKLKIGIGLPTTIAGASPGLLARWARQAEAGPFASVAVHDRLVSDSLEPLAALAAAAAVTERVRLAALVVIGPLRNSALLAKQAATLDVLSGGRLSLGLGAGHGREDYLAAGVSWASRGSLLEEQLRALRPLWEEARLGPVPVQPGGPELLVGGLSDAALLRMARYSDGFVHAGGPPRAFASAAERAQAAWSDAGRPGRPRIWGVAYFALGEGVEARGQAELRHHYGSLGAFSERIAAGLLHERAAIAEFLRGYRKAGCDELVLFPTVPELEQVDRLADLVAGL